MKDKNNNSHPMPEENDTSLEHQHTIDEMRRLFEQAEEYAEMACEHLVLDLETGKSLDQNALEHPDLDLEMLKRLDHLRELFDQIVRADPLSWMKMNYTNKFIIHFLFPNLSEDERLIIENIAAETDSFRHWEDDAKKAQRRKELGRMREGIKGFEMKLTALQMTLIDSTYCDPESEVWHSYWTHSHD